MVIAAIGKALLPDDEAARLVFVVAVVGYVAVVRLRLRRDRIRSTVEVWMTAELLRQTSRDPVLVGEVRLASARVSTPGRHAGELVVVLRDDDGGVVRLPQRVLDASPEVADAVRRVRLRGLPGGHLR